MVSKKSNQKFLHKTIALCEKSTRVYFLNLVGTQRGINHLKNNLDNCSILIVRVRVSKAFLQGVKKRPAGLFRSATQNSTFKY